MARLLIYMCMHGQYDHLININFKVVMCKFHSVFLSVDGKVFTCGHGRGGRLGHGNEETLLVSNLQNYYLNV